MGDEVERALARAAVADASRPRPNPEGCAASAWVRRASSPLAHIVRHTRTAPPLRTLRHGGGVRQGL